MMHWYYGGMGWGGWLVMALAMVAFWALVVYAVVAITRSDRRDGAGQNEEPKRILEQRYARGEIGEDEYRRRQAVLRGPAQ
ncbi:MAG TPA: SHOCT domain-containing protein [Marmoricola sp.]|nr:SHOCT domain-containing protein [Marmoricola sp.]